MENTPRGVPVDDPLYTYDPENAILNYEVLNIEYDGSPFVVSNSGQIRTRNDLGSGVTNKFLNFEFKNKHVHIVRVHDHPSYIVDGRLSINLKNVEEIPKIRLLQNPYFVQENVPLNTLVGTVIIFDEDFYDTHASILMSPPPPSTTSDPNGNVCVDPSYFSIFKNESAPFDLKVRVSKKIDYEECQYFSLILRITDVDGKHVEKIMEIKVIDVNDITVTDVQIIDDITGRQTTMATIGNQTIQVTGTNFGIIGNIENIVQLRMSNDYVPLIGDKSIFHRLFLRVNYLQSLD